MPKIISLPIISFLLLLMLTNIAHPDCTGCCSHHNGVCCINYVTMCCDRTPLSDTCKKKGCNKCGTSSNNNSAGNLVSSTGNLPGSAYPDSDTASELNAPSYPNSNSKIVRLYGIDCPEHNQAYGYSAKSITSNLVLGRNVKIEAINVDRYDRIVAIAIVSGLCINEQLVRDGYAWVYEDFCEKPQCTYWLDLEMAARSSQIGLWAGLNPVPPWEWRNSRQYDLLCNREYLDGTNREYNIFFGTVTEVIDGDTFVLDSATYDLSNLPANDSDNLYENEKIGDIDTQGYYDIVPDGDLAPFGSRDGTVDVGDAIVALRFALGIETPLPDDMVHGDIAPLDSSGRPNPDGYITVGDALVILRKALGII
jgi:endonuclease YncB( thermonuclease family)